jgi:hypothetical protein
MAAGRAVGDVCVHRGTHHSAAFVALTVALVLGGCTNVDTSTWFSRPLNLFGGNLGYNYSQLDEAKLDRPITANDLVDANGACPRFAAAAPTQAAPGTPGANPAAPPDSGSLLGSDIAIGMSECDVVARVGQPTAVNIGGNPDGSRNVVMTVKSGPRPGVYRFESGRLSEMDRVEQPPPPPPQPEKKKTAKKKPATTTEPPKTDNKS